jgi:hypothetical protein
LECVNWSENVSEISGAVPGYVPESGQNYHLGDDLPNTVGWSVAGRSEFKFKGGNPYYVDVL